MRKPLPLVVALAVVGALVFWLTSNRHAPPDSPSAASPPTQSAPAAAKRAEPSPARADAAPSAQSAVPIAAAPVAALEPAVLDPQPGKGPLFNLPDGTSVQGPEGGTIDLLTTFLSTGKTGSSKRVVLDAISFDSASGALSRQSYQQIRAVAVVLKAFPNVKVRVEDNAASRAEAVKLALVDRGVGSDRVTTDKPKPPAGGSEDAASQLGIFVEK
jgi:outer membrane protein OmpA-like peptidoglycan-associated protein